MTGYTLSTITMRGVLTCLCKLSAHIYIYMYKHVSCDTKGRCLESDSAATKAVSDLLATTSVNPERISEPLVRC